MVIAGQPSSRARRACTSPASTSAAPRFTSTSLGAQTSACPDDSTALQVIREEVGKLGSSAADYYRHGADAGPPHFPPHELDGIFPPDHRMTYDAPEVIARLVDRSLFWEVLPDRGREMIVGVGRVNGLYMGFVANRQGLIDDPDGRDGQKPAGILYREGIAKVAAFSRACDADGIPIVWLQDISGFDIGVEGAPSGRGSSATARRSSTPTAPTRCPCSRSCSARRQARGTTPWRGSRTSRSSSSPRR